MSFQRFTEQALNPPAPAKDDGKKTIRIFAVEDPTNPGTTILRSIDSDGNVVDFEGAGPVGPPGPAGPRSHVLTGGVSAVSANMTQIASMGHNNSVAGITVPRNGEIQALSITMTTARSGGTCDFNVLINGVIQNGAGETVTIDAVNTISNLLILGAPIAYNIIELQTTTVGFNPGNSDATLAAWTQET